MARQITNKSLTILCRLVLLELEQLKAGTRESAPFLTGVTTKDLQRAVDQLTDMQSDRLVERVLEHLSSRSKS